MKIGDQKLPEIIVWFGGSIGGVSEIGAWLFLNCCSFPTGCSREFDSRSLPRAHTLKQKNVGFFTHTGTLSMIFFWVWVGEVFFALCSAIHSLEKKVTEKVHFSSGLWGMDSF